MITFLGPHDNSIIGRGRGGSLGTPNLYYVIYGRPLKGLYAFIYGKKWIWSGVTDLLQTDSQLKIELLSS